MDSRLLIGPGMPTPDPTARGPWNISSVSPHRLMELSPVATTGSMVPSHPFPTVDVPDHAHYTIGVVILAVGITGMLGNFLVIYAFCRSRSLRTPSNIFIINLAVTDLLMCLTQTPIFFITSMHKRWIFGKKGVVLTLTKTANRCQIWSSTLNSGYCKRTTMVHDIHCAQRMNSNDLIF